MADLRNHFPRLIRCELLTYVFTYMHRFPREKLAKTVLKFYRSEEISLAKDLLWEFYEEQLGVKQERQIKKDKVSEMETRDIIKAALELDKRQVYGKEVAFAATDLERVPKPSPEERVILSLLDRVSILEAQVAELNRIKDTQLFKFKEDQNTFPVITEEIDRSEDVTEATEMARSKEKGGEKEGQIPKQKKTSNRKSRRDLFDSVDSGSQDNVKLLGGTEGFKRERFDSCSESKKEQDCVIN